MASSNMEIKNNFENKVTVPNNVMVITAVTYGSLTSSLNRSVNRSLNSRPVHSHQFSELFSERFTVH